MKYEIPKHANILQIILWKIVVNTLQYAIRYISAIQ